MVCIASLQKKFAVSRFICFDVRKNYPVHTYLRSFMAFEKRVQAAHYMRHAFCSSSYKKKIFLI
jgi:hypothetical protein